MPETDAYELITLKGGRAMLVIDYAGAREARSDAHLRFDEGHGVLEAPGQTRPIPGLRPEAFKAIASPFLVSEVDGRGRMMRLYRCTIEGVEHAR